MADSHADMPADSNAAWAWKREALSALLKKCTPEGVPPNRLMRIIMQRFLIICNAETQVPTKQFTANHHTCAG